MPKPRLFMSEFERRVYSLLRETADSQGDFYATFMQIAKIIQGRKANPLCVGKAVKHLVEDGYLFAIKQPFKTNDTYETVYTFFFN